MASRRVDRFTDRQIKNLKPEDERFIVWEKGAHGLGSLGVRVAPTGRKTWIYQYRFNGRARMMTLGVYPEMSLAAAHAAHGAALDSKAHGLDPGAEAVEARREARQTPTVSDLVDEYLERYAKKKKRESSWKEDKRVLHKDVVPKLGERKIDKVGKRDIHRILDAAVDRGAPIQANRTLAVLRKMFNFGLERHDVLTSNPCSGVRAPSKERSRNRVLSRPEIKTFLANLSKTRMLEGTQLTLKFQLLTAQRIGEVVNARWDEIDEAAAFWTIPAEKTKNAQIHAVPLSPEALRVLEEARTLARGSDWVFPGRDGSKAMTTTAPAHGVRKNLKEFKLEPFRPHDLRRTAASHMTRLGVSRLVVSKILNHKDSGITAIYDRYSYDRDKREGLERWGREVERLGGVDEKQGRKSADSRERRAMSS